MTTLTLRRELPRLAASLLARYAGAAVGHVVDANGRRGALAPELLPLVCPRPFAGSALTVATVASDNLAPYAALSVAQPGDVLVIAAEGCRSAAVTGDVMVGMAKNAGVVAVIADGMVRDIDGLEAVGIPVFALGLSPNSPQKNGPGRIGFPVSVCGMVVEQGDLVVGDRNGVCVVRHAVAQAVLAQLDKVRDKERAMDASVAAGAKVPEWLHARLAEQPWALED
ncbi:MAG: RraA family protein [Betaproteobacteria bacterium]